MHLFAPTWPHIRRLEEQIKVIAEESCEGLRTKGFPPHHYKHRCHHIFDVDEVYGRDWENNTRWNLVDNPQARMVAAAGHAPDRFDPVIDPARGCGETQPILALEEYCELVVRNGFRLMFN